MGSPGTPVQAVLGWPQAQERGTRPRGSVPVHPDPPTCTHQGRVRGVATALGPHNLQGLENGGGRVSGYPHAVLTDLWGEELGRGESRQGPQDPLGHAPKITWTPGPGDTGGPAWCQESSATAPRPAPQPWASGFRHLPRRAGLVDVHSPAAIRAAFA